MSPLVRFNVQLAEIEARWNYHRQFLAPAIVPITQATSPGEKRDHRSSGHSHTGKSRKFRMARLTRHGQMRLWDGKES